VDPLGERTLLGLHESLIAHLPASIRRDAPVLDIGCGTGAWLERLASAGFSSLHGIDQDVTAFGCSRATASKANLEEDDLALGERRFDLITCIEVVEHLENPGRLYRHVRRLLAPGGYFLMTTPNIQSLVSRLRHLLTGKLGQFDEKGDPTHIAPLLLLGLERTLPRHGLELAQLWGYPASGSIAYRKEIVLLAGVLRCFLPDDVPGDVLCMLIQHAD
jgi:2-polyprenyl-3-methyl-5-hydroxy-6-metoxy-1,4-benzoquinol methylase